MDYYELLRLTKVISLNPPRDSVLQPFLTKFVTVIEEKHMSTFWRIKDLEQLAWLLFHLNYTERGIFEKISVQIDNCKTNHPYSGRCLVFLTNFMLKAGVLQQDLVSDLMERVNNFRPFQSKSFSSKSNTVDNCLEFLYDIYGHNDKRGNLVKVSSRMSDIIKLTFLRKYEAFFISLKKSAKSLC